MRGFIFLGLIILVLSKIFEMRCRIKKIYTIISNFVSTNEKEWQAVCNDIIQKHDVSSLEKIIGKKKQLYLIVNEILKIKTQALNNEKKREISDVQYEGIMKKFEKQNMFYTFNIDTSSIYYRFNSPYENYILWIYI